MKINFNIKFRDLLGNEVEGDSIGMAVAQALFFYGNDTPVSREDKYRAYCISQRIISSIDQVEITTEEATLIKEACGNVLTSGGYGQVYKLIEGLE